MKSPIEKIQCKFQNSIKFYKKVLIPNRPNIIANETVIVLRMGGEFRMSFESGIEFRNSLWPTYRVDVGNRETTEDMSVVDATLANEM